MNTINKHKLLRAVLYTGLATALATGCANKLPMNGDMSVGAAMFMSRSDFKDYSLFQGSQDRSDMGWKLYGEFDPGVKEKVVFEGGYAQMGDTTFDGLWQGVSDQGTIETDLFEASVGYRYPFTEKFSAGGRVGAAYVDVQEDEIYAGTPESHSASETVPFGGVVFRYAIGERWGIAAHYDRYLDVGKVGETGEGDIEVYGINADFRFGDSSSK